MMRRVVMIVVAFTMAAVLMAGCGGGGSNGLGLDDQYTVATFRAQAALDAVGGGDQGALMDATDQVIALARQDPEATYDTDEGAGSITMRQVLSDGATTLASSSPEVAAQLDRAVASLE